MPDADLIGAAGIAGQGPYMQVFAKIEAGVVSEASYQTYSCPNAIACGSWMVRWMEGRNSETLSLLTPDDLRLAGFRNSPPRSARQILNCNRAAQGLHIRRHAMMLTGLRGQTPRCPAAGVAFSANKVYRCRPRR
jgi:NifU-like protein involved in Fe-S cluster formation